MAGLTTSSHAFLASSSRKRQLADCIQALGTLQAQPEITMVDSDRAVIYDRSSGIDSFRNDAIDPVPLNLCGRI